jgi:hypothetical protein
MRAPVSSLADMTKLGPPFLHLADCNAASDIERAILDTNPVTLVRRIDAARARNLPGLCDQLAKDIGAPRSANFDALKDVMCDPGWVTGRLELVAAVYIVENAGDLLRDIPGGFSIWGTMAENWARSWASPSTDDQSSAPVPLHFVHCAKWLPKDSPQMSRLELEPAE